MVGATSGFEYDSAGNQTRAKAEDGSWLKFEYDAANRLLVVKNDSGTYLQAFQYGSSNQRLMDLDYIYGYLKILAHGGAVEYTEFAGTVPTWTKSYIYLGDSQLSTITPDGSGGEITEYNHPDRLGTKLTTNQSLGTSYEQTTLPFGTALNAETSGSQSKRFTSYERSARTGLDYAINRTYDSKQGRFTQVDPIGISASSPGSPQTLNLYTYCGNDPVNHIDPDGLFFGSLFKWIGKIFKAINKILKWVIVAVVIATVVIAAFYSLGAAAGFLKVMMGIVAKIAGFAAKATGYIIANFASAIGVGIAEGASISAGVILNAGLYGVGAVASAYSGAKGKRKKGFPCAPTISRMIATFRNTLNDLFLNQSGHQTDSPLENGGWIYQRKDGSLFFRKIGKSQQWRRESGQINLDNPPTIKGARVVGVAHTHPYSRANQESFNKKMAPNVTGPSGWNGERGDITTANSTQMPDLVVYENKPLGNLPAGEISVQIWGVGPERIPDKNCR